MTVPLAELSCEKEKAKGSVRSNREEGGFQMPGGQTAVGLGLATSVIVSWAFLHVAAIFFLPMETACPVSPLVIAGQCWLYVGLFIIAHDCMHGSLVPFRPSANRAVGTAVLFLYAGFSFNKMNAKHHAHHRYSGTDHDPDFDDRHPHGFWPWYGKFFTEYLTWRQPLVLGSAITFYAFVLGAPLINLFLFWALPSLLSSLQLFTFGTYLPHRPGDEDFIDSHNARTNDFCWMVSLLTCFHFGYHHEHHLAPRAPWWRLPAVRSALRHEEQ